MAQSYSFNREIEDDLIEIKGILDKTAVILVLDTGASHTIIDFGILIKEGYRLYDTKGLVFIETANGIIQSNKFIIRQLKCLGIVKTDFEVSSYLFDDPQENIKGIIGLDFLTDVELCLNFKKGKITIN